MKNLSRLALAATVTLLSSCHGSSPDTNATASINASSDDGSNAATSNGSEDASMKLPPAIAKTTSYRCEKAGVVSVDFMADNVTALLHPTETGTPVSLTAPAAGQAFVGGGYTLSGDGASVKITAPGKPADSCNS